MTFDNCTYNAVFLLYFYVFGNLLIVYKACLKITNRMAELNYYRHLYLIFFVLLYVVL